MIEPRFPHEGLLTGCADRLEQSTTHDELIAAFRCLFIRMGSKLFADGNTSNQDKADIERINEFLKYGLPVRKPGRPNADERAASDARLFQFLRPKTIADGARLLRGTEKMLKGDDARKVTDSAWRKRAKLATERGGYVFPAKGKPFGRSGQNVPGLIR